MADSVLLEPQAGAAHVGKVAATVRIINHIDAHDVARGIRSPGDVRAVTLESVLVDTGADTLCLPESVIARLGLPLLRDVEVRTAGGSSIRRLFSNARVELAGRSAIVECLELPEGTVALLGAIPMEALGVEPDLQRRVLRLLPESGPANHFTA